MNLMHSLFIIFILFLGKTPSVMKRDFNACNYVEALIIFAEFNKCLRNYVVSSSSLNTSENSNIMDYYRKVVSTLNIFCWQPNQHFDIFKSSRMTCQNWDVNIKCVFSTGITILNLIVGFLMLIAFEYQTYHLSLQLLNK